MTKRITKKDVKKAFTYFCKRVNIKEAKAYNDVGGYRLNYASWYGGYCIEQIANENGGVHRITQRYSGREMIGFFEIAEKMAF